jgi:hypothetical protein
MAGPTLTTELQSSTSSAATHASSALADDPEMALHALPVQQESVSLSMQSGSERGTPQPLTVSVQKASAMALHWSPTVCVAVLFAPASLVRGWIVHESAPNAHAAAAVQTERIDIGCAGIPRR